MSPSAVVVFAGPSMHGADAAGRALLERCDVWAPAGRGDVLRALSTQPRALVLIDGYFHRVPAVTHQELLYALDAGVPVFGAASMGALRAAELERFGMTGVGRIFAAYRDGVVAATMRWRCMRPPVWLCAVRVALVECVWRSNRFSRGSRRNLWAVPRPSRRWRSRNGLGDVARAPRSARLAGVARGELETVSVKREDGLAAIAEALGASVTRFPGVRRRGI